MKVDVEVAKPVDFEKRHKVYRNGKSYIAIEKEPKELLLSHRIILN